MDLSAEKDMGELLKIRGIILGLLETARQQKFMNGSLEAEVDIILPDNIPNGSPLVNLLRREEKLLKMLFIVSDVTLVDKDTYGTDSSEWSFTETVPLEGGEDTSLSVRVRAASRAKCPRCWTYTREHEDMLCRRCSEVLGR